MNSALIDNPQTETDADLIAAVALQTEDRETALAALHELHTRYSGICLALAVKQEQFGIDPEIIVSRTYGKVWNRADTFDPNKSRKGVEAKNAVRNWILTILENQIKDAIKARSKRPEVPLLLDGFHPEKINTANGSEFDANEGDDVQILAEVATEADEGEEFLKPESGQMKLLKELMAKLTGKERLVLMLCANHIEPNPPFTCRIPQEVLVSIAAQIGVAPSSIKVLRQRILNKLRAMVENR